MNSIERRIEILEVLSINRSTTVKCLSEKFGVSTKTIERDIDYLTLKYPIYTVSKNFSKSNSVVIPCVSTVLGLLEELLSKIV